MWLPFFENGTPINFVLQSISFDFLSVLKYYFVYVIILTYEEFLNKTKDRVFVYFQK